jgi:hypothetical protein
MGQNMSLSAAAARIVSLNETLVREQFLGPQKREALMVEQAELWDSYFPGRPYDEIAKDGWQHKLLYAW